MIKNLFNLYIQFQMIIILFVKFWCNGLNIFLNLVQYFLTSFQRKKGRTGWNWYMNRRRHNCNIVEIRTLSWWSYVIQNKANGSNNSSLLYTLINYTLHFQKGKSAKEHSLMLISNTAMVLCYSYCYNKQHLSIVLISISYKSFYKPKWPIGPSAYLWFL